MANKILSYEPDYAIHPGEILEETLDVKGLSQIEFSKLTGLSKKQINLILNGKASVTPDSAIKFERILGVKASTWLNLNSDFQLFTAKKEEEKEIRKKIEWAKKFPIKELVERKLIPKCEKEIETVKALLTFFKTGSVETWNDQFRELSIQFRESPAFRSSPQAIASWMQIGTNSAKKMNIEPYNRKKFETALIEIRKLTNESPEIFTSKMKKLCAESGVGLTFVPEFKDTHISGATYWYSKHNVAIIMSLRYKTDDHFWFTFFHEAGHVLIHKSEKIIIDGKDQVSNQCEDEANKFAEDILIPPDEYSNFLYFTQKITKESIKHFSEKLNIAPGIIVGRLQKEKLLPFDRFYNLKRTFKLI